MARSRYLADTSVFARLTKPTVAAAFSPLAAEACGLVVLHYDADFELVAEITGQPHEWVVARGTAD